jgi:tol-pal system protein YbgF
VVPSSDTSTVEQETPSASIVAQAEEGQSAEAVTSAVESEESPPQQVSRSGERSDKVEYERLLALFRDGDLDGARQGFATFLRDNPNSDLSPNARFWLGESHYGKKDFRQAIDSYDRVELDFPQSEKVPSAILKKGYAYLAMKDKKRATSAFKQVVTLYPRSPEAGKASDKLSQLKESR